jgi:uncharacterized protein YgiM (DUF1202 family)
MLLIAGLALTIGPSLQAQPAPYDAAIALPEVAVRSGPSPKFYVTSKLTRGERVRVLEDRGEWLAIAPPKGSFSWINSRLIEKNGHAAIVLAPEAPTRVGSALINALPDVEGTKLQRGAQVVLKPGPPVEDAGGIWHAIDPPPQEVRFLPKDAVQLTPAVERISSGYGAAGDLWQQAEQAERQGNIAEAHRLYSQLAAQTNDHELQVRAYNRLEFLRQGLRGSTPPGYQPGSPEAQGVARSPYQPPFMPTGQSQSAYNTPPAAPAPMQSSPGRLRRAGFFIDGKQAYVLEDHQGRPVLYATSSGGLNLDGYLNRVVTLSGPMVYRGDLRTNYITAYQATMLP